MSGLSRTPGKRVWVNSPPRVRIPLAPPKNQIKKRLIGAFLLPVRLKKYLATAFLRFLDNALCIRRTIRSS
jgi:hypothetical protein